MPDRLLRCLDGKRASFLLIGALAYLLLGLTYVLVETTGRNAAFSWLPPALGSQRLGWVWLIASVIAGWVALTSRRHRGHALLTGYIALAIPPAAWAAIFLTSWILGRHEYGFVSAISYGLMTAWVIEVSDWPNPVTRHEQDEEDEHHHERGRDA